MERRILFVSLLPTLALAFALAGSCGENAVEARAVADAPSGVAAAPRGVAVDAAPARDRERATAGAEAKTEVVGSHDEPPSASLPGTARRPETTVPREPDPEAADARTRPGEAPPRGGAALPPLEGAWLERLELEGYGPAYVSVPLGATAPRPVMVGVHGRGDRPEWACGEWRGVTDAHPFILCPHGIPKDAPPGVGLRFADAKTTEREIRAGLAALHRRFGAHVASGPLVYAGFSLGAILAPAILTAEKHAYPFAILAEGGQDKWTPRTIAAWRTAGGRRVLLVCSTRGCEGMSRPLLGRFEAGGIEARLASAGNIGHLVDQRVIDAIRPEMPWLVAGDARWTAAVR